MSSNGLLPSGNQEKHEKKKKYTKKKGTIWTRKQPRVHYGSPRQRLLKRKQNEGLFKQTDGQAKVPTVQHSDVSGAVKTTGRRSYPKKDSNAKAINAVGSQVTETAKPTETQTLGTTSANTSAGARRGRLPKRQKKADEQSQIELSQDKSTNVTTEVAASKKANTKAKNLQVRSTLRSSNAGHQRQDVGQDLEKEHFAVISRALEDSSNIDMRHTRKSTRSAKATAATQSSEVVPKSKDSSKQPTEPSAKIAGFPKTVMPTTSETKQSKAATPISSPAPISTTVDSATETSIDPDLPRLAKLQCNSLKLIRNRKRQLNDGNTQLAAVGPGPAERATANLDTDHAARTNRDLPSSRVGARSRPAVVTGRRSPVDEGEQSHGSEPVRSERFTRALQRDANADARPESNAFRAPQPPRRFDANRNRNTDALAFSKQPEAIPATGNAYADVNDCRFELFACNSVTQFGPQTGDAQTVRPTDPFFVTRLFVRSANGGQPIGAVGVMQIRPYRSKVPHPTRKPSIFSVIVADKLCAVIDGRQTPLHAGDYFFVGPQARVGFTNDSDRDAIISYSQYACDSGCYVVPATASNVIDNDRGAYVVPPPSAPAVRGFALVPSANGNANRGREPLTAGDRRAQAY